MTMTPSTFLKNCWVKHRYLPRGATGQRAHGLPSGRGLPRGPPLTSPARPCPTAAGPPGSRPHAPSSCGNRCLQGEGLSLHVSAWWLRHGTRPGVTALWAQVPGRPCGDRDRVLGGETSGLASGFLPATY